MSVLPSDALPAFAALAGAALGLWLGLRRSSRIARRARALFGGARGSAGSLDQPVGFREAFDLDRTVDPCLTPRAAPVPRSLAGLVARRPSWLVAELALLPLGLGVGELTGSVILLVGAAIAVVPLRRWRLRRRSAAEARRRVTAVIDLCAALAAELRSGDTPERALHAVIARMGPTLARTLGGEATARLAAARYGAAVPDALRLAAELPGGRGAAAVAACWQVSAESGTGLAAGLDHVADALRAERALAEEIAGELAGSRATVAMLAALPLIGTALGAALGAKPVQVLLHTPAGLVCLLGGVLLETVGLAWTARIVRAAEDTPGPACRATTAVPIASGLAADTPSGCGISRVRSSGAGPRWSVGVPRPREGAD